jgi:hypothetical protein
MNDIESALEKTKSLLSHLNPLEQVVVLQKLHHMWASPRERRKAPLSLSRPGRIYRYMKRHPGARLVEVDGKLKWEHTK